MKMNTVVARDTGQTSDTAPIIEDLLAHIGEAEIAALQRILARVLVDQAIAEYDSQAKDDK